MRKLRENKIFKLVMKIIKIIMVIFILAFVVVVFLQRFSNNRIAFFDYRMFTVVSGSMEPKYKINDVLIAKKVEPSTIKIGDTISYEGVRGTVKDKVITHEVVGINKDQNGKYLFSAKGLSNIVEDPIIYESQLYGKVVYKSIILSLVYHIVGTDIGFYLFIIIPLLFIIVSEILVVLLDREEKRRNNN